MIPLFKVSMTKDAAKMATEVLESGFVGQGPKVDEFEKLLKQKFDNDKLITVNSATSGLHLAIHLLKIKYSVHAGSHGPMIPTWPGILPDDEILTSPLTCTATNWPALANGMKIKWVDVDPLTCNMDLNDLERKISSKTKVILLVHWGGNPIDLDRVREIQLRAYHIYGFKPVVIEDCAHAMGATYKGKPLGNHGNIAVYSFQAIKHFTTVDGGCIIFPHQELYKRAKLLRWYGIDRESKRKDFRCEGNIPEWGFKFHMNDLNAAIGIANFPNIDLNVKKHIENSNRYDKEISNPNVISMQRNHDSCSSQWIHTIFIKHSRDEFIKYMTDNNIMASRVHERNDKHTCVSEFRCILPGVDKAVETMVCIPNGWWLDKEKMDYIISKINLWQNN